MRKNISFIIVNDDDDFIGDKFKKFGKLHYVLSIKLKVW